jgi:uncharacterized membrane protein YccC
MTETMATPPASGDEAAMPKRRFLGRLRDRIVASDPAYSRLRLASRAILSMILTGCVLAGITLLHPLPIAAYGIGIILSFTGSMSVRDKTGRGQMVTRLYGGAACVAAVLIASFAAPVPAVADIVFLVVIFTAVLIRKFGQRGFAIGMMAFMAYFMGDYLHPAPAQIGWVALAAGIALVVTHAVSNLILVDDPERDFRRAVVTIDRRINLILRQLRRAGSAGAMTQDDRGELNDHLARLHDIMLMAEGFIPQGEGGGLAARGAASDLAVALFDLQLAVERLVAASLRALPPAPLTDAVLNGNERVITEAAAALSSAAEGNAEATQQVLIRVHRARQRLGLVLAKSPSPAFRVPEEGDSKGKESPERRTPEKAVRDKDDRGLIPSVLQLPIQVTLASAIAMSAGLLISSTRWYWAVITAFIVFNNTRSRADTAVKALQRSGGTLAGLVVGTIVATLMQGQTVASLVAMVVLFFVAFYFIPTSYGLMIFFITIAIALLYGLMGVFTPELLVLRLAETVIGALSGVFVAFFVFPKRATSGVTDALDAYLTALQDLVSAAREQAHAEERDRQTARDLLALSRALDRNFADLAAAARPLGGPWNVVTRFGEVREKLLLLTGCTHWGRALARGVSRGETFSEDELAQFDRLAAEIGRQIARARGTRGRFFLKTPPADSARMPKEPRRSLAVREDENPILALEVISALLQRAMTGSFRQRGRQGQQTAAPQT